MDLFKLRVFVTVVDRGGYSAAAEHLGLAQSTMSFHVCSLEQRYAVPLMRYEHRAVRLTPAGQRLYQTARIMLAEEEQLVRVISGRHSGQVKLGASMAFEQGSSSPTSWHLSVVPSVARPGRGRAKLLSGLGDGQTEEDVRR